MTLKNVGNLRAFYHLPISTPPTAAVAGSKADEIVQDMIK